MHSGQKALEGRESLSDYNGVNKSRKVQNVKISKLVAIPVLSAAAIFGSMGIASAHVNPTSTPTITNTISPLPNCGYIRPAPFRQGRANRNCLVLTYNGGTFYYPVTAYLFGDNLYVTLRDNYLPGTLECRGLVLGTNVLFGCAYPNGDPQGFRVFDGTIGNGGHLAGNWTEDGTEQGNGTWYLSNPV